MVGMAPANTASGSNGMVSASHWAAPAGVPIRTAQLFCMKHSWPWPGPREVHKLKIQCQQQNKARRLTEYRSGARLREQVVSTEALHSHHLSFLSLSFSSTLENSIQLTGKFQRYFKSQPLHTGTVSFHRDTWIKQHVTSKREREG